MSEKKWETVGKKKEKRAQKKGKKEINRFFKSKLQRK
jgi:hypothetical protein